MTRARLHITIRCIKQVRLLRIWPGGFLTIFLLFCLHASIHAQVATPLFVVSKSNIKAANEELVDLVAKVKNRSAQTLVASVYITADASLDIISKAEIPIEVQPGDSIFLPIKIFVNKQAQSGTDYRINLALRGNNTTLAQTGSILTVSVKRSVNLFSIVSNILLDNNADSVIIPVRISNTGNTAQKITLISTFPAAVQDNAFHASIQAVLQPASDTLIYFRNRVNRKMQQSEGFNVTITGLYDNSDMIGMAYVRVQSARSNRNYRDQNAYDNYSDNTLTLSSQSIFSPTQSYMLRGRGNVELAKGNVGYSLDLTAWKSGFAPALLRNTWLEYQTDKFGVRAGSIDRNLDIYLTGRGASIFVSDTASGSRYEAGIIDGNTNLLGGNSVLFPTGQAGWGVYTLTKKRWQFNSFVVHENNPLQNSKNTLFGNSFSLNTAKNLRYTFGLNAGRTSEFSNSTTPKFGVAVNAGFTGTIKNLSVNSVNYFSTGYYPGIQRGALSLSERVTWIRPTTTLWVNFEYNRYNPQALTASQYFLPAFGTLRAEAGISGKIKKISITAAPRHTRETSNAYQFGSTANDMQSLSAWDMSTTLNYPIGENQYLSMNTEAGIYSSSFDAMQRFHLRSSTYYKKGIFRLTATVQLGTFFIGEAANNFVSKVGATHVINLMPTITKSFFRNKLRTETSIAYMNSGYSGSSWYLAERAEYDLTAKTNFYTAVNYNRFGSFGSSIIEMGITQKLQVPKLGAKNNSLELFVFKDINRNGIYDTGDSAANGFLLYVNNDIFISPANGTITYKNLPDGSYRLTMPISNGWYAPEQTVKLDKKVRIAIPLQRTGILKGSISYIKNEFSYEIGNNLSGITVSATDRNNHIYTTKTGVAGDFVFYVPAGDYSVSLNRDLLPAEIETVNNEQQVTVEPAASKSVHFEMKVKARKIETKKFSSASLK